MDHTAALEATPRDDSGGAEVEIGLPQPTSTLEQIWRSNQFLSILLRLPPEVRNRIYELLMVPGHIYMFRYRPMKRHAPNGVLLPSLLPQRWGHRALSPDTDPFRDAVGRARITLLSRVCRQLYVETAALPFQRNRLSFGPSADSAEEFILRERRLSAAQRQALREIHVQCPAGAGVIPKELLRYLSALCAIHWVKEPNRNYHATSHVPFAFTMRRDTPRGKFKLELRRTSTARVVVQALDGGLSGIVRSMLELIMTLEAEERDAAQAIADARAEAGDDDSDWQTYTSP